MKPLSFIHAADIHLDSPFVGINAQSPHIAQALQSATFRAFDNLINLCISKHVDFLLLAGDIYDGQDRSLRAQLALRDGLHHLSQKGISSFIVHGNHDPLSGWSKTITWPERVHIFDSSSVQTQEFQTEKNMKVFISGMSYEKKSEKRNLAEFFKRKDNDTFHIGLLHCSVGTHPLHETYAPCQLRDLIQSGIDYWALGHVHEKAILHQYPFVVYPGNTQGRNIKEMNERGCFHVKLEEDRRIEIDFHSLDTVRWHKKEVNIAGLSTLDQIDRAIITSIEKIKEKADTEPVICYLTLTGRTPLWRQLGTGTVLEELRQRYQESYGYDNPFLWVQKIEHNLNPEINREQLRKNNDLPGQVTRIVDEILMNKTIKDDLFTHALSDLYSNYRLKKLLPEPSESELIKILKEAELFCLDRLEPEE